MASYSRQPRALVTLGSGTVEALSAEVTLCRSAQASTFSATLALQAMEAAGVGLSYLASETSISAGVSVSTGTGDSTLLISGSVDTGGIVLDLRGQSVTLTGRDVTANLTDTKNTKKYINQTSDEIAQDVAGQAGLSLDSDGGSLIHGKIYTDEQDKLPAGQSNFSLLRQLAESEGKDVCVVGDSVYFKKVGSSASTFAVTYVPATSNSPASSSATRITLSRNFQVAGGVTVKIASWDYKKKQLITSTATIGEGALSYSYNYHQMPQDRADKQAKSKATEHAQHEYNLTVDMPGDPSVNQTTDIAFSGTGTDFDQTYKTDQVVHRISASGYEMRITAKTGQSA